MRKMTNSDWIAFAVDFAEAIIKVEPPQLDYFHDEYLVSGSDYGYLGGNALLRCRHFNFYLGEYLDEGRGKTPEELIKEQIGFTPTDENLEDWEDENNATLCCMVHHIMWDLCEYGEDPYGAADELWAITNEIGRKHGLLIDFGEYGTFHVSVWEDDEEDTAEDGKL